MGITTKLTESDLLSFLNEKGSGDKLIKSYRKDETYQKATLRVVLECKYGNRRDILWNAYKRGMSNCTCETCLLHHTYRHKKWDNHMMFHDFFIKFGIEPMQTPDGTDDSVISITPEGYLVLASVSNLRRSEKNGIYTPDFDKFGIRNKYQFANLKLFCQLERPDYQITPQFVFNADIKQEIYFKYIGNNLKPNICRYFKTSIDKFIHAQVSHPALTMSKGEMRVKNYLDKNKVSYKTQYTNKNCKDKSLLKFDFAIYENNILLGLVEFDGSQHDNDTNWFGINPLEGIKRRDGIKNKFCLDNNIPLLRIKQSKIGTTEKQLKAFISECKKEKENQGRQIQWLNGIPKKESQIDENKTNSLGT